MWERNSEFCAAEDNRPMWLTIGLGLSACATQEQIRSELENEEGRALIKEAVQAELKTMMKSEGHKVKMKEMMMKMKKEMDEERFVSRTDP